ncbi:MAG: response regulator [Myxococcota bacterium]
MTSSFDSEGEPSSWLARPLFHLEGADHLAAVAIQEYLLGSLALTTVVLPLLSAITGEYRFLLVWGVGVVTLLPGILALRQGRLREAQKYTLGYLAIISTSFAVGIPNTHSEIFLATNLPALYLWIPSRHAGLRSRALVAFVGLYLVLAFLVGPRVPPLEASTEAIVRGVFWVFIPVDLLVTVSSLLAARDAQEKALAGARDAAEASARVKTRILNSVAHELRSPLSAAIGLLAESKASPTLAEDNVAVVLEQVEQALSRTTDLLDFARLEGALLPPATPRANNPATILTSLVGAHAPDMRLQLLSPELDRTYLLDGNALRRIVTHLLSNAVRYGGGRGWVRAEVRGSALIVQVEDLGPGIPEGTESVFEPMETLSAGADDARVGQGMGLALARGLAHRNRGDVELLPSPEGAGAHFELRLPCVPGGAENEAPSIPLRLRVLVVEDEQVSRLIVSRTLKRMGCEVEIARDGIEGLASVRNSGPFDLVLMDIRMPRMDGLTATRLIKQELTPPPVVALTANALAGDEERCRDAGMDEFMAKPLNQEALLSVLGHLGLAGAPESGLG